MRWIWVFLWLALSLFQLIAFLLRDLQKPVRVSEIADHGEGLVDLAKETNAEWSNLLGERVSGPAAGMGQDPMDWEVWLLELSEAQQRFEDRGMEVDMLEDLRRWLSVTHRDTAPGPVFLSVNTYLVEVLAWIEAFAGTGAGCHLRRVQLEPGSETGFPGLYFELDGTPESMGCTLFGISGDSSPWQVGYLQLVRGDNENSWWLMGNCMYDPESR